MWQFPGGLHEAQLGRSCGVVRGLSPSAQVRHVCEGGAQVHRVFVGVIMRGRSDGAARNAVDESARSDLVSLHLQCACHARLASPIVHNPSGSQTVLRPLSVDENRFQRGAMRRGPTWSGHISPQQAQDRGDAGASSLATAVQMGVATLHTPPSPSSQI